MSLRTGIAVTLVVGTAVMPPLVHHLTVGAPPVVAAAPAEPWSQGQVIQPAELARLLSTAAASSRPTVVCVGFPSLFHGAHLPAASLHGPASSDSGLADLKRWADPLSRSTDLVIYCGCCPFTECPNVRPAFRALASMGFTHVRVLELPHNLATDWIDKGYPIETSGVSALNQYRQRVAANGRPPGAEAENPLHVDFGRAPVGCSRTGPEWSRFNGYAPRGSSGRVQEATESRRSVRGARRRGLLAGVVADEQGPRCHHPYGRRVSDRLADHDHRPQRFTGSPGPPSTEGLALRYS